MTNNGKFVFKTRYDARYKTFTCLRIQKKNPLILALQFCDIVFALNENTKPISLQGHLDILQPFDGTNKNPQDNSLKEKKTLTDPEVEK